ncbi:MAG: hypothetical protein SF123_19685 [Chloroflexota bacterium]|nr:hypothetical protein [Chloroflexota bacterium]
MSNKRYAAKRDENEPEIEDALLEVGATVDQLNGDGTPDLLVGYAGVNYLMEVKSAKGTLTRAQQSWHRNWQGVVHIVRTPEEALAILGFVDMNTYRAEPEGSAP